MGIFKRIHRITIGRISAFLDRAEDPEQVFPVLVSEMENQLRSAVDAQASALASVKQNRRVVEKRTDRIERFTRSAVLALEKGDEQTARMSIEAQVEAQKNLELAQSNLDTSEDALDHASAARKRIESQLQQLRAKKDELLTRARVAKTQKKIQSTVSGFSGSADSILDAVARLEAGVEQAEAQLEIQAQITGDEGFSPSLEMRLDQLDQENEIEKRLAELKKKIQSPSEA